MGTWVDIWQRPRPSAGLRKFVTKAKFKDWLESLPPGKVVGYTCDTSRCPLARYLSVHLPKRLVDVELYEATVHLDDVRYTSPKWIVKFVDEVDKPAVRRDAIGNIIDAEALKVTAKQALAALRKA